jgi:di/tricarboxylate transporter
MHCGSKLVPDDKRNPCCGQNLMSNPGKTIPRHFVAGTFVAVAGLGYAAFGSVPEGWSGEVIEAAGLTIAAIAMLASGVLPIGLTAIAYFLLATLFAIQPATVIFSGFQAGATWLVFGGLVIGVSVGHTGLGKRLAESSISRIGGSYLSVLAAIATAAIVLSFLIPSAMGRSVLMVPVLISIAERMGFGPGSRGRNGMIIVAALVSFSAGGTILSAHLPGLIMAGAAETLYGIQVTYAGYLAAAFPVLGLLRAAMIVLIAWWLFHDTPEPGSNTAPDYGPFNKGERMLGLILVGALALWFTDSLHGVSAAWVSLAAGVVLLIPGLGLVPPNTLNERLDYGSFFYTAAVVSMGAVIAGSGLAGKAGDGLVQIYPMWLEADWARMYLLTSAQALLGPLVTNPGIPAVLSPLAGQLAEITGLPVKAILFSQVFAFTNVIVPYHAAPYIVALTMAGVSLGAGARMAIVTTLAAVVILVPLQLLWWHLTGLF